MTKLTFPLMIQEQTCLDALTAAWNAYQELPHLFIEDDWERIEFMQGIHILQNIILARPTRRAMLPIKVRPEPPVKEE